MWHMYNVFAFDPLQMCFLIRTEAKYFVWACSFRVNCNSSFIVCTYVQSKGHPLWWYGYMEVEWKLPFVVVSWWAWRSHSSDRERFSWYFILYALPNLVLLEGEVISLVSYTISHLPKTVRVLPGYILSNPKNCIVLATSTEALLFVNVVAAIGTVGWGLASNAYI